MCCVWMRAVCIWGLCLIGFFSFNGSVGVLDLNFGCGGCSVVCKQLREWWVGEFWIEVRAAEGSWSRALCGMLEFLTSVLQTLLVTVDNSWGCGTAEGPVTNISQLNTGYPGPQPQKLIRDGKSTIHTQ